MALYTRKMLVVVKNTKMAICLNCSPERCPEECGMSTLLPPPPPVTSENHHMPYYFIVLLCVLGAIFVFICYMITLKKFKVNIGGNSQPLDDNSEDYVDENHGPDLDHPVWYIHTIGLPRSIIESILVFKYKKNDGLIEGSSSDCSVCLTEFEEDECLRLLPKCSHAFHVSCIDTWLSSHTTCPLCRAPIVSDLNIVTQVNNVESISTNVDGSSPSEVNPVENRGNGYDLENQELGEEENGEMRVRDESIDALSNEGGKLVGNLEKIHGVVDDKGKGLRASSDLAGHRVNVVKDELQPARRSVSMDSSAVPMDSSAVSMVHIGMSEMSLENGEGCSSSDDQLVEEKTENSDTAAKRGNKNSSIYEAMKSCSFGRSLQKVPICMKRSFSTSGKCSMSSNGKGQEPRESG